MAHEYPKSALAEYEEILWGSYGSILSELAKTVTTHLRRSGLTVALLDRLTHKAHIILSGDITLN